LSKGLVFSSRDPSCGRLLRSVADFEAKFGRPDCVGGVGFAVPAAVLYAAGFSPGEIAEQYSKAPQSGDFLLCEGYFSKLLTERNAVYASDIQTKFCVPVIDIAKVTQFSFTNIPELFACAYEERLSREVPLGQVLASSAFGLCDGFEFGGKVLSAGYRNLDYLANRLKTAGCESVFCLTDDGYLSCEFCSEIDLY